MSEEFGSDFITIVDDDGQEFELEVLDTMDYNGETYLAFLPASSLVIPSSAARALQSTVNDLKGWKPSTLSETTLQSSSQKA